MLFSAARERRIYVSDNVLRLHCGGCDMVHESDGAFALGHPCPLCNWALTLACSATNSCFEAGQTLTCEREHGHSGLHSVPGRAHWRGDPGASPSRRTPALSPSVPECQREYMINWNVAGHVLDHEERRMYLDDHAAAPPRPPTIREWLGNHVHELGRWADVLREQPVPAGMIVAWEWRDGVPWALTQGEVSDWSKLTVEHLVSACEPTEHLRYTSPVVDSMQMALFTRHPAVKPAPRPAAFPWDPYQDLY